MAKKIKYVIKWILKFNDFKNCLLNNETIIKLLERLKSKANNAFTEKIALSGIMIKDYRLLMKLCQIHIVQALEKYEKQIP